MYKIKLLLFSCLSQISMSRNIEHFILGHDALAIDANFSKVENNNRLYSLGKAKENGYFESVCARGKVEENASGILLFYLIRETNGKLEVKYNFEIEITKDENGCISAFDNEYAPQKNDIIGVFIGNQTFRRGNKKFGPVLIAFQSNISTYMVFEGSNLFKNSVQRTSDFNSQMKKIVPLLSLKSLKPIPKMDLNVRVRIIRSFGRKKAEKILAIVIVCVVIIALLAIIALLVVKALKRRPSLATHEIRLCELPNIEVCEDDADDASTEKDFGDVKYLLQKDRKRGVVSITKYHGSNSNSAPTMKTKTHHTYSLLTNLSNEPCDSTIATALKEEDHEYDEPYFEPACTEETLFKQLKSLGVPLIAKELLRLCSEDVLGHGAFGSVHRGVLYSVLGFNKLTEEEVAVKTLEDTTSEEDRVKFLQEAAIMGQFSHPNIIKILGIVISPDSCKLVIEVMSCGDLRNHLHTIKPDDLQQELAPTLLSYSRHVANGMMYLAMKSFVHRDLAARNVLVADDGVCKIADFGLSRKLQNEDYYVSHGGKIPVKWTAPEALHYHKYSTASDVWSYGCVLYEIWSLGEKPYHNLANEQIIEKLSSGFRLSPPPGCPREVYKIMIQCWHSDPVERPSFMDITAQLQKPDYQVLKWKEDSQVSGDTSSSSKEARIIGAALEAGFQLHQDLQKTYAELT